MQTISDGFELHANANSRRPTFQATIDWDLDGAFTDESDYTTAFEVSRIINEPLGSAHQGQADLILSNYSDRFSPNSSSPITDYIKIGRLSQLYAGFFDELLSIFKGISEPPIIDESKKEVRIHFWDEMEKLREFNLSDGSALYEDIRTDWYIWQILDEVYSDYFTIIASFDSDETITGGTAETENQRGGDQAIKLEATAGGTDNAYKAVSLDLSGYASTDKITFFVYIEDIDKVQSLLLRLHTTAGVNYGDFEITDYNLITGWNQLEIEKGDVSITGSFNWASIVRAEFILDAVASQDVYAIIDELRIIDSENYPTRVFDIGLQNISFAYYEGNTALQEIKYACESEGARFYADELGVLHFESRQFYNNNDEYKSSVAQLAFDKIIKYEHPKPDNGIINSVSVQIHPRVMQATKVIWTLGEVPEIGASETLTIWASFTDPVPVTVTGLVTPVSTTDYTANDQADGGGTNRTANISIAITKFTNAAKLEITNNHSGAVFLTLMQLRGTPIEEQGTTTIRVEDSTSIDAFGEKKYTVDTKYLSSISYAQTLAQQIIDWYADPIDKLTIEHPALPYLQIGDMISVVNDQTENEELMRIIGYSLDRRNNNIFRQKTFLRTVTNFELLTFFEIGTSSIGGTDVIAP